MFSTTPMNSKIVNLLPIALVVTALLVSMYLVFNTDSLVVASQTDTQTKKFVAGASCPAPDSTFYSADNNEINFVGCGGFF